jgi:four helix bundle protein
MERTSSREKARFLDIAKGSCAELRTQVFIGTEIGYLGKDIGRAWVQETREISAMLSGLIKSLPTAN